MPKDIPSVVAERKIPFLLHFTRLENLPTILEKGIVPRSVVDEGEIACEVNDQQRWDGRRGFNCLSISFPNGPMFFKFKNDHPAVEWPILVIDPTILSEKRALFCKTNAANAAIAATPDADLETVEALEGLFAEIDGASSRADQSLKDCDPSDVQAEVLIEGVIDPKYIMAVVFPSVAAKDSVGGLLGQRKAYVQADARGLYGTRGFYRVWGRGAK